MLFVVGEDLGAHIRCNHCMASFCCRACQHDAVCNGLRQASYSGAYARYGHPFIPMLSIAKFKAS